MSKLRGNRLESEIEKCRLESNWKRLHELYPVVAAKNSGVELLANFLMGEALLENFIDSFNGAFPKPDSGNKETLKRARKYLHAVFDANDIKPQVSMEAHLLLAKLHYLCGQFDDALGEISKAKLEQDDVQFYSLRSLRLITEAYAIKALCIEALPARLGSRFQKSVRDEQVLDCFEKSAELALTYLQELEKCVVGQTQTPTNAMPNSLTPATGMPSASSSIGLATMAAATTPVAPAGASVAGPPPLAMRNDSHNPHTCIGGLIETSIQRVPISYIKRNDIERGVAIYRKALAAVDGKPTGQTLQQVLSRQLAEVLLRGVAPRRYRQPRQDMESENLPDDEGFFMPKSPIKFSLNTNDAQFAPSNKWEEAYLLLTVSEALAAKEAVLTRSDEHANVRATTLLNVKAVQNLLTLVLSTLRQYQLLSDLFDRAMKFAYEDHYIWMQFALTLVCQGKYARAASVLAECLQLSTSNAIEDSVQYMLIAKLCIEQLGHYDEGIRYAEHAVKICRGGWLTNRAQLLLGLAYGLKAQAAPMYADRKLLMKEALTAFGDAVRSDPKDHLAEFFFALHLAMNRDLDEAKQRCQKALLMRPEQPAAVLLLALLLTAENQYNEALDMVKDALDEYPMHYGLMVLRMKLEMKLQKVDDALDTAKDLLLFWRLPANPASPDRVSSMFAGAENVLTYDQKSAIGGASTVAPGVTTGGTSGTSGVGSSNQAMLTNGYSGLDLTDKESVILSTTGPLTEYGGAVSTISESFGVSTGGWTHSAHLQYRMQANIWLELAELFLDYGRLSDVQICVDEACNMFPNSHQAIYLKGRMQQTAKRWKEAKACYLGALGLFPCHIASLRHLAMVYDAEGNVRMAEKVLRDLMKIDPLDHHTWFALGEILVKSGEHHEASKCFDMALELEDSSPIMPFSAIPRVVNL